MESKNKQQLVGLEELRAAQRVIAGRLHRTPMFSTTSLGKLVDAELYLKAELFQKTGSFKPRGALNKLESLSEEERARGVITISAGNHAQGVAFAAGLLGVRATVVMPEAAVQSKVEATRGYGGKVVLHGTHKDLLPKMLELQREQGLTYL